MSDLTLGLQFIVTGMIIVFITLIIMSVSMWLIGLIVKEKKKEKKKATKKIEGFNENEIIALAPSSPQEMFDFTIKAFNFSERFRVPVAVMSDEYVAHLKEKVIVPPAKEININPAGIIKGQRINIYHLKEIRILSLLW